MIKTSGYAATSATSPLTPFEFTRRDLLADDVHIKILYCGICHSDLHIAKNEWHSTVYPVVPGHEIVGTVIGVGKQVTKYKVGDLVAVGCLVDSCGKCESCEEDLEQYCDGTVFTYNSPDAYLKGKNTYGGYSDQIVVKEDFVLRVPASLDTKKVAPLLCAGITTYSPLRHWKIEKHHKVGVVGLGGLGHMAVKIAHAMGAHVTMITTSANKIADAKQLGANDVILSTDAAQMQKQAKTFDFIINTIPRTHDVNPYLALLKRDATMVIVGAVEPLTSNIDTRALVFQRRNIAGSLIGGIKETQEMLDFCAKYNVLPEVEMISMPEINHAYERLLKNDVKYRFVIDMNQ